MWVQVHKTAEVQSVVKESYILAMIQHPCVLKHKETFISKGQLVVVAEYCTCGDLQVRPVNPKP